MTHLLSGVFVTRGRGWETVSEAVCHLGVPNTPLPSPHRQQASRVRDSRTEAVASPGAKSEKAAPVPEQGQEWILSPKDERLQHTTSASLPRA